MQNNKDIEKDVFSEMLHNRLENVQLQVDENCWAEIEQRMKKKKKIIPVWFWLTFGGVAAVVLLMLTLRPFIEIIPSSNQDFSTTLKYNTLKTETSKTALFVVQSDNTKKQAIKNPETSKHIAYKHIIKSFASTKVIDKENEKIASELQNEAKQISNDIKSVTQIETKSDKSSAIASGNSDMNSSTSQKEDSSTIKKQKINSLTDTEKVYKPQKNRFNKTLIAAALGTGGGASLSGTDGLYASVTDKIVNATTDYTSIMAPSDFTTISHLPPVSFGVKINKGLSENWSIESGLVYTYLVSLYKNGVNQTTQADLELHYLGIPVNFVNKIKTTKNWEIYISGGGMVEKGLRSIYNQKYYIGSYEYTTVVKSKIPGVQWSANAGFGAAYKLNNELGLYIEPTITYYFNNNQPMSARTEQPLIVGLNAGLRFKLK